MARRSVSNKMSLVLIQYRILFETNEENGVEEEYLCLRSRGQIKWFNPNVTLTWSAKYDIQGDW